MLQTRAGRYIWDSGLGFGPVIEGVVRLSRDRRRSHAGMVSRSPRHVGVAAERVDPNAFITDTEYESMAAWDE